MKFKVTLEVEIVGERGYAASFSDYESEYAQLAKKKAESALSTIDYNDALYGCIDDTLDGVAVTKCVTLEKLEFCK